MNKCYCPDAKLRYGEPALCEYCAILKGQRDERKRCETLVLSLIPEWVLREAQGASIQQALEDAARAIKGRSR